MISIAFAATYNGTTVRGKVSGTPDTATFSVTYSDTKPSIVNQKVRSALQVLANNQVRAADITTSLLSYSPDYDYTNGTQRLKGQQASQTLNVKIRNITSNDQCLSRIFD